MIVEDAKDSTGRWLKEILPRGKVRRVTSAYSHYSNMRSRTTGKNKTHPNYEKVSNGFSDFQEFAEWCQSQVGYLRGFQLDKDLLDKSALLYSPSTCVFLPPELNTLLIKRERRRGEYPVGVCLHKQNGLFMAQCANGRGRRQEYLGLHKSVEDAFNAYKVFKEDFIKSQAEKWRHRIDPRAYEALMKYEVQITD